MRRERVCHSPGHLYEYQNKRLAKKGVCKSVKEEELGKWREARIFRIELAYTRQTSTEEV